MNNIKVSGFTLLELTVVVLIISLIAGSGLVIGKAAMDSAQVTDTHNRLNAIEAALMSFRNANHRLPCPADGTLLTTAGNYGLEVTPGTCTGTISDISVDGPHIAEGVVPVRSLGLPDHFMYDSWGRKITYAAWLPGTATNAFLNYGVIFNCGKIMVFNATAGATLSTQATYALLSYGPNGHGAYTTLGTKYGNGSVNADELANCHCDGTGTDTGGYIAQYVMKDPTEDPADPLDSFDDIVRFKERWQIQNALDAGSPTGNLLCPYARVGFRADGELTMDASGFVLATGDINGDGIADLFLGAIGYPGGGSTGAVYVIFGKREQMTHPFALADLDGTNGFRIDGLLPADYTGFALASGDVNGDGIDDLIIGASTAPAAANNGSVFVVYGKRTAWAATVSMPPATSADGVQFDGVTAGDYAGYSVAAGDINGDGMADVIIGAPGNTSKAYAVFGAASYARQQYTLDNNGVTGIINANDTIATTGVRIDPAVAGDGLGWAVAAGDINGDGVTDMIFGHPNYTEDATANRGLVSVIPGIGSASLINPIKTADLNGENGWRLYNGGTLLFAGQSLAVGDMNGDGFGDIVIGAPDTGGADDGAVFVYFGNGAPKLRQTALEKINAGGRTSGFVINGIPGNNESTGTSLAVGDVNGDKIGDIIVGAPTTSGAAGATYVVFGSYTPPNPSLTLNTLNGVNGFALLGDGAAGDTLGWSVASGDINGDTRADIITAGYFASHSAVASGSTYVLYGQKRASTYAWTHPYDLTGF